MVKIKLVIDDCNKISEFEDIVFKYGKKFGGSSTDVDSQVSSSTSYDVIYFSMECVSKDKINDLIGELNKIGSDYLLQDYDSGEVISSTAFH